MIPEIALLALIVATGFALLQAVYPFQSRPLWPAMWLSAGQWLFTTISFVLLVSRFLSNDFTVRYVAEHSNSTLPWYYKIAATWGGHEGSLLLWILLLSSWAVLAVWKNKALPEKLMGYFVSILGWISLGFYCFILFTSNPFARLLPYSPTDGADLNPLLQDFGLIIHPPILYMGYVGFAICFALALAALIQGDLNRAWLNWAKPWCLAAWAFLTLGITLGSWWAYYELGWGGFWFWDPVENASLMPWLAGTALIHAMIICERRGIFKKWTVILAIASFSLSLLGTFLVRSGVLTSVHAFASDPTRGYFILLYLAICIGAALIIYALRVNQLKDENSYGLLSRESLMLLGNVFIMSMCGTVVLGTLYPLIIEAFGLGKISVGPPYFNAVVIPMALCVFVLMGVVQVTRWGSQEKPAVHRLLIPLALSILVGVSIPFLMNHYQAVQQALGFGFGIWLLLTTLLAAWTQRAKGALTRSFLAMVIAHLGVGITVIGITATVTYSIQDDVRMAVGDTHTIGNYQVSLKSLEGVAGPNYRGVQGQFVVYQNQQQIAQLQPEKRIYTVSKMPLSETAIARNWWRDIYIAMGEPLDENVWAVRIYFKPMVHWIWLGGVMMMFAGLLAVYDKRYVLARKRIVTQAQTQTREVTC